MVGKASALAGYVYGHAAGAVKNREEVGIISNTSFLSVFLKQPFLASSQENTRAFQKSMAGPKIRAAMMVPSLRDQSV